MRGQGTVTDHFAFVCICVRFSFGEIGKGADDVLFGFAVFCLVGTKVLNKNNNKYSQPMKHYLTSSIQYLILNTTYIHQSGIHINTNVLIRVL